MFTILVEIFLANLFWLKTKLFFFSPSQKLYTTIPFRHFKKTKTIKRAK